MNEQISLFDSDIDKRYQFYGHYCNDDWSTKTAMVDDLKDLVNRDTVTVHSTSLFKDSPVFVNSSKNYPILKELVPPNEALYWPNQFLFRTYTGLNVNMEIFDINALNKEESELMKSNYYHDIYVKDSEVFVHVK
ncbi:hypothetical protein LM511_13195 (plasmid) [Enterococcus faecalis]|uniref:hypothetical protein n=1 Tax=Enterococcus faecalis TaxID=1351 RepID=UPI001E2BC7DA|nr:hypothetical protein [Enterococcus faecalis]UER70874.1 hypothetical protein LM505_15230 [Enterococcus faecalis]UER73452.1 hypothetical protein LM512_13195 [Enterococcus faecalis]UER78799.1 hypothetical protein LM511_13195 [Enterococcus faecalis]